MERRIDLAFFDRLKLGRDPASVRMRIEAMERLLERLFVVPGINRPVGLDTLIGFVPVVGDLAGAGLGAWMVWEARNLGLSKFKIARMAGNVGLDTMIGLVPFVGDVADFLFRSNTRNLRMLKRHLDKHHPATAIIEGRATP
jgi:hypothetical protein